MDNIQGRTAWARLLADTEASGPIQWGALNRGGCLHPDDRTMDPRCGDYGAGWAGEGVEATAQLSIGGNMFFNPHFHTGQCCKSYTEE